MPLLVFVLDVQTATALVGLTAITTSVVIIWESWHEIEFKSARQLVVAALIGIPVGLWLLRAAPERIVVNVLGICLIAFGLYSLTRPALPVLRQGRWAYLFGFIAGCLGGAYNAIGPAAVVYVASQRWPPRRFRATLQGFLLPSEFLIAVGHGLGGLWTRELFILYSWTILFIFAAIVLGSLVNRRISMQRFNKLIYGIITALGVLLIIRSISN